jgi:hypothetical protein
MALVNTIGCGTLGTMARASGRLGVGDLMLLVWIDESHYVPGISAGFNSKRHGLFLPCLGISTQA